MRSLEEGVGAGHRRPNAKGVGAVEMRTTSYKITCVIRLFNYMYIPGAAGALGTNEGSLSCCCCPH